MSTYCKAYYLAQLHQFPGWSEKSENTRKEKKNKEEVEISRQLANDDFLYIHSSYIVTDGIFEDKNIIFDNITPEWKQFCKVTLKFNIPKYKPIETEKSQDEGDKN